MPQEKGSKKKAPHRLAPMGGKGKKPDLAPSSAKLVAKVERWSSPPPPPTAHSSNSLLTKNKKKKKKKKKPKVKVEPLHAMEDELAGNKVKLPAIQNITAGDVGGSGSQSKSSLWKRARKHSLTMIETVLSQGLVRLT